MNLNSPIVPPPDSSILTQAPALPAAHELQAATFTVVRDIHSRISTSEAPACGELLDEVLPWFMLITINSLPRLQATIRKLCKQMFLRYVYPDSSMQKTVLFKRVQLKYPKITDGRFMEWYSNEKAKKV